jgi:hypothetical protein
MGQPRNKADYQAMSIIEAEKVWVQCYSGNTYAERPESFIYRNEGYKVKEVEKEWREPGERHFRVLTEDRKLFELCYNDKKDDWSLGRLG